MTAVLADAGPLYAIAFESDQYHLQARADMERLAADRLNIMVTYSTVVESYALVLRNAVPEFAFVWHNALRTRTEFILPIDEDYLQAAQLIQRFRDQPITLADGLMAIISQRLKLPVWSYDHHFDVMRIDRWRQPALGHQHNEPLLESSRGKRNASTRFAAIYAYFLKIATAFCPPNPNAFTIVALISIGRASFGT